MLRINLFIIELFAGLEILNISTKVLNEAWNIILIVIIRLLFFWFEKKFPSILKRKNKQ